MERVVQDPNFSTVDFLKLVGRLQASGATRYAEQALNAYIFKAKAALTLLSPNRDRWGPSIDIADYALHRQVLCTTVFLNPAGCESDGFTPSV